MFKLEVFLFQSTSFCYLVTFPAAAKPGKPCGARKSSEFCQFDFLLRIRELLVKSECFWSEYWGQRFRKDLFLFLFPYWQFFSELHYVSVQAGAQYLRWETVWYLLRFSTVPNCRGPLLGQSFVSSGRGRGPLQVEDHSGSRPHSFPGLFLMRSRRAPEWFRSILVVAGS